MPNSLSEFNSPIIALNKENTNMRIIVCKIYYKKIKILKNNNNEKLRRYCNLANSLTSDIGHNLNKNCEDFTESKTNQHPMWSKFNKGIIYTTKGLRKAENEYINAVITGNEEGVARLLKSGVNPNVRDSEDTPALQIVAERGDIEIGKLILNAKEVDINATVSNGDSPLITAVRCGREGFVQLLLNHGANPNITNHVGATPLIIACCCGFVEIARYLLLFHANPNIQDAFGDTPLIKSMIEHPNKIIVMMLLRYGANPNYRTMRRHPLFLELALHCRSKIHMEMINIMILSGVNMNIQSSISKYTALHIAAIGGNIQLAKYLLEKGAKMGLLDFIGRTPYDIAVEHGHLALVRYFKNWKKQQEEIRQKEAEAKKSALTNKEKKPLTTQISQTSARAVTFSESSSVSNAVDQPRTSTISQNVSNNDNNNSPQNFQSNQNSQSPQESRGSK